MIKIGDITITKREILVSISIFLMLLTIGFGVSEKIADSINSSNEKYFKSLKIDNDKDAFIYAYDTNIGDIFAYGQIEVIDPVSINDIKGQYAEIRKVKEEYTRHERKVQKTKTVNGNTVTYYETEVYYSWDYQSEDNWKAKYFNFLGKTFEYKSIDKVLYDYHIETIKESSTIRYKYYVVDIKHNGSIFLNIHNNEYSNFTFYKNQYYKDIITFKEEEVTSTIILFWITWFLGIFATIFLFVYFDNHYLED